MYEAFKCSSGQTDERTLSGKIICGWLSSCQLAWKRSSSSQMLTVERKQETTVGRGEVDFCSPPPCLGLGGYTRTPGWHHEESITRCCLPRWAAWLHLFYLVDTLMMVSVSFPPLHPAGLLLSCCWAKPNGSKSRKTKQGQQANVIKATSSSDPLNLIQRLKMLSKSVAFH